MLKSPRRNRSKSQSKTPRKFCEEDVKDDEEEEQGLIERSQSSVQAGSSRASYSECVWSREETLKKSTNALTKARISSFYPHGLNQHGELTLVGKTRYRFKSFVSDKIGEARKSTLQLEVEHLGRLVKLESFVVLGFDVASCFEWSKNTNWALRVGYAHKYRKENSYT